MIRAASDTSRNFIVNPFRIYVTKLRKIIWLTAFCCFLVGCCCKVNFQEMPPEDGGESSEAPALPQSQGALARRGRCAHRDDLLPLTVGLCEAHGKAERAKRS